MMRKQSLALCLIALFALAGVASAVMTNTSGDQPVVSHGNVLTDPGFMAVGSILYAPSEADDAAYRAAISAAVGGATVDYFDARVGTPSVSLLSLYDCVYTWANYPYADNATFGNNLAAYVDGGGRVILGVFCTYTSGNFLGGAIMTLAYCPVVSPLGNNHFVTSTYAGNGTSCIHAGVATYACVYRDYLITQGAGVVDGNYLDGEIGHAFRPDYKVIYSNGAGAAALGGTGDWARLVANACSCGNVTGTEEATWGKVKTLFR
jgi:hypothetical protein